MLISLTQSFYNECIYQSILLCCTCKLTIQIWTTRSQRLETTIYTLVGKRWFHCDQKGKMVVSNTFVISDLKCSLSKCLLLIRLPEMSSVYAHYSSCIIHDIFPDYLTQNESWGLHKTNLCWMVLFQLDIGC